MSLLDFLGALLASNPKPVQAPEGLSGGVVAGLPGKPVGDSTQSGQRAYQPTPSDPRGIRNNNPGNILRSADQWQGMAPQQTDGEMIQFVSPEYGLRALILIARSYQKRGLVTVQQFVETWCPPKHTLPSGKVVDNHTPAYVSSVCTALGSRPEDKLDLTKRSVVGNLLRAVVRQENGSQPYNEALLQRAMDLAGVPA